MKYFTSLIVGISLVGAFLMNHSVRNSINGENVNSKLELRSESLKLPNLVKKNVQDLNETAISRESLKQEPSIIERLSHKDFKNNYAMLSEGELLERIKEKQSHLSSQKLIERANKLQLSDRERDDLSQRLVEIEALQILLIERGLDEAEAFAYE